MLDALAGLLPQFLVDWWATWPPVAQYLATTLFKILIVTVAVILCVAFSTYFERKVIGKMQSRVGPNRVGWKGLLQPFADVFKLLFKEVIVPSQSSRFLYTIAPLLSLIPALARSSMPSSSSRRNACPSAVPCTSMLLPSGSCHCETR